ncbi:MAG: hypothetical protein K6F86_07165 [Lachnospiraceae bacterium]|nr:hypothetical protein [Lachnospiraceae bacterium]
MMDNKNIINDSDLGNISGGVIFNASGISGADRNKPWEVLDDRTGNNIYINGEKQVFETREKAIEAAKRIGANHMEVTWDQVLQMREQ